MCYSSSPAGFYVYPSVKILQAPAMTQADGQLACRATSTTKFLCPDGPSVSTIRSSGVYTDINTNVAAYFSGQLGPSRSTDTYTPYIRSLSTSGTANTTSTYTISRTSVNTSGFRTTADITFPTPFLFFPAAGISGMYLTSAKEIYDDHAIELAYH